MNKPHQNSTLKPILIFPAGMPRALDFCEKCIREGQPFIGSSSLNYDISKEKYSAWCQLPYITEPAFNDALREAIATFDIGGIYTPNPVAWSYLDRVLKDIAPEVPLVNGSPVNEAISAYRIATNHARQVIEAPLQLASSLSAKASLSQLEIASLFRHGNLIPGMCDDMKIYALCEIARYSTQGDVVEIGSWWGKSAFILARLARCFSIGKTLCVDPWSSDYVVQNDEGGLVDSGIGQYDCEEALRIFEMNLLPYSANDINYLRMPSIAGAMHYSEHKKATTDSFGTIDYCGKIAILHIDGNHSYEAAKSDIAAWTNYVVAGGWIVIDDYVWPYGDGPKRAGDEYLAENRNRIGAAFVMGTALFIQLSYVGF